NINKIPQDLKDMLKAAKEFKVKLELLQPTQEIKNSLPIWQHSQANDLLRLEYNIKESKCLRNKHNILTVGQTKNLTQRITRAHKPRSNCPCYTCREERLFTTCNNPHK